MSEEKLAAMLPPEVRVWFDKFQAQRSRVEPLELENAKLRAVLEDANGLCRSAYQVAARGGLKTNWPALTTQLGESLKRQLAALAPAVAEAARCAKCGALTDLDRCPRCGYFDPRPPPASEAAPESRAVELSNARVESYRQGWEKGRVAVADLRAQLVMAESTVRAQMSVILSTIGGSVEGHPTASINYLQRLRELVQKEAQLAAAQEENRSLADWRNSPERMRRLIEERDAANARFEQAGHDARRMEEKLSAATEELQAVKLQSARGVAALSAGGGRENDLIERAEKAERLIASWDAPYVDLLAQRDFAVGLLREIAEDFESTETTEEEAEEFKRRLLDFLKGLKP